MKDNKTPFAMDSKDLLAESGNNSEMFPSGSVDKMLTRPYSSKASLVKLFASEEMEI